MNQINAIFQEVLKEILPRPQDIKIIKDIIEKLKELLIKKAHNLNISYTIIEPQGSTGIKQTHLRNDFDIDLFIGLDYSLYKPKYEGLTKNKLKKVSKREFLNLCNNWILKALTTENIIEQKLLYAEHPYVSCNYIYNNLTIKVDIVLFFDLDLKFVMENGPITAVDRSPWHGRFVRDRLSTKQKDDVRLLKQFFIANHCYGDKCAVGKIGFIGYSAELLIYHFKTLIDLFHQFHLLKDKAFDPYNRTMNELRNITHFQNDTLLIIDPIDKNRNVASAISERAYNYCNYQVKKFLEKPILEYFEIKEIEEENLNSVDNYFIIELFSNNTKIHYTIFRDKLYSLSDSIKANAEKEFSHADRFGRVEYEVYFEGPNNEYNIVFYCEKPTINRTYIRKGPPMKDSYHVKKFKAKNPGSFERNGHLWIETKRDYSDFIIFLKDFIKDKIPDGLILKNISKAIDTQSKSAKKAITVLKTMVMPFL
ncbi:MAG: hypothetical protein ACFFKA_04550 [Candidatus Thorarchaeota archaeon]